MTCPTCNGPLKMLFTSSYCEACERKEKYEKQHADAKGVQLSSEQVGDLQRVLRAYQYIALSEPPNPYQDLVTGVVSMRHIIESRYAPVAFKHKARLWMAAALDMLDMSEADTLAMYERNKAAK